MITAELKTKVQELLDLARKEDTNILIVLRHENENSDNLLVFDLSKTADQNQLLLDTLKTLMSLT